MLLNFGEPKHPSGNCYVSCLLTDRKALSLRLEKFKNNKDKLQQNEIDNTQTTISLVFVFSPVRRTDSSGFLDEFQCL